MKFDLIKYNASQDTPHPIRNKWFRFYKYDRSNEPDLPKEYMGNWDSVKNGHPWKKTGKWDPIRLKELRTQVEEWFEFVNRDENLIPIHGYWRCYYWLWRRKLGSGGELIILLPQLYIGHSEPIRTLEKMGWWLFNKLVFSVLGLFIWLMLMWLFTITLISIPLVLLGIIK